MKKQRKLTYSDIELERWREYPDVLTESLWIFGSRERGDGHKFEYHGNFIPQIATQLFTRYTKADDVVLDLFLGCGTSAIEAVKLGRKFVGVDINPELTDYVLSKLERQAAGRVITIAADSAKPETGSEVQKALLSLGKFNADFLILHPPYWDIIKFSELEGDMSCAGSVEEFLDMFGRAAKNGYKLLAPGRFAGLVIGDKYANSELVPLGFLCMQKMNDVGFRTKSIIVKNIEGNEKGKGRTNNLWRYRALAGGFYIFKHEYIMVFRKPE